MNRLGTGLRAAAVLLATGFAAACSSMLDEETIGSPNPPAGGVMFSNYNAIGTSISAGIQSGGINDSTQREAFTAQLAAAMGLSLGVDWFYPSLKLPGCPAPFTNPLIRARVGGDTSSTKCALRDPASFRPINSNVGIPFLRAQQATDITLLPFPTDTVKLTQFVTGGRSPVSFVMRQNPTFVTVEVGANDALHAATRGDTTLLTAAATFATAMTAIADSLDSLSPQPNVAIANVAGVTAIPNLTRGLMFYCLKNGCPTLGIAAAAPYSNAGFLPNANCAPNSVVAGSKGDSAFVGFQTTAGMTGILNAGAAATLDCVTGVVTVNVGAGFVAPTQFPVFVLQPAEYAAVNTRIAAFNSTITTIAARPNYALVDLSAALVAALPQIPPFPSLGTPTALFGPLFSLDGVHPTKAGHKIIANAFIAAINTKGWGPLTAIP